MLKYFITKKIVFSKIRMQINISTLYQRDYKEHYLKNIFF